MTPVTSGVMLAASRSLGASLANATVATALGLVRAWLARNSRAAHTRCLRRDADCSMAMPLFLCRRSSLRFLCNFTFVMVLAACAVAQDSAARASISGVVVDASSGLPVGNVPISITPRPPKDPKIVTDEHGRFKVTNHVPRGYIIAPEVGSPNAVKMVTLWPGQNLASIVIAVRGTATISGRVLDANNEPLPDMLVAPSRQELFAGVLRYVVMQTAITNPQGEYRFNCQAGRTYYLAAQKRASAFAPSEEVPADPALRPPTFVVTWFPRSAIPEAAEPVSVHVGELREDVDFVMLQGPSLCLQTVLEANGRPAPLNFSLMSMSAWPNAPHTEKLDRAGIAGRDGKIRMCEVPPGEYRIDAWETPN
jgi:type IV secretory pathway protease TraF